MKLASQAEGHEASMQGKKLAQLEAKKAQLQVSAVCKLRMASMVARWSLPDPKVLLGRTCTGWRRRSCCRAR
jgi:hypothetical protein